MTQYETGELVLCTVEKIEGATVFVKLEENNMQGSIVMSEVAPGRIRNLREYVFPQKKIVCKILKVFSDHLELSLRRVIPKERKEVMEMLQKEHATEKLLHQLLKEKAGTIIANIKKNERLGEFFERIKTNPAELEKIVGKENASRILESVIKEKEKNIAIKRELTLTTDASNGLALIKETLQFPQIEMVYYGGGKYALKTNAKEFKTANNAMKQALEAIEQKAKKKNLILAIKEK